MIVSALTHEWKRVEMLCTILQNARQGQTPNALQLAELSALQDAVNASRASGTWGFLSEDSLSDLALDVIAVVAAPDVSYSAGFACAALAQDTQTTDLSLRLLQALLSIQPEDHAALLHELRPEGELVSRGLIALERRPHGLHLRCGRKLKAMLWGKAQLEPPPGAREVFAQGQLE